jgi:hypothetical protein
MRCVRLAANPALLRQPGIKLAPLGELKIGDRETVGLKVTQKGFPDIDLFFDKKTGLPYKTEIRQKEGKQGMEMPHAFIFDNYKEFGGVKQFTRAKFLRDDKSLAEIECSDFKPQEKLDDSLFAKPEKTDSSTRGSRVRTGQFASRKTVPVSPRFRLEAVAPECRDRVRAVLEHPSLHAHGPVETFHCQPSMYHWLLDHPDRAVGGYQKLGVKCAAITDRGNGRFGWKDKQGSDIYWDTVLRDSSQRVWYAVGAGRAGSLKIPLRAVVILYITEGHDREGRPAIRHEGELILHTDNRLAAQVMAVFGPHAAEQYVGQIQTFFAALAWHLDRHPEKAKALLAKPQEKLDSLFAKPPKN